MNQLDRQLLVSIFKYLDVFDIGSCACACMWIYRAAHDDQLWKYMCSQKCWNGWKEYYNIEQLEKMKMLDISPAMEWFSSFYREINLYMRPLPPFTLLGHNSGVLSLYAVPSPSIYSWVSKNSDRGGFTLVSKGTAPTFDFRIWQTFHTSCISEFNIDGVPPPWSVVAFSTNFLFFAEQNSLRLNAIELHTKTIIPMLGEHQSTITSVSIGFNGERGISCSYDNTARLWDLRSGLPLAIYRGHSSKVISVCLHDSLPLAASGGDDQAVKIWSAGAPWIREDGDDRLLRTLVGHTRSITSVIFDNLPNSHTIFSASYDSTIRSWDFWSGSCLRIFEGHLGPIFTLELLPHLIISGSRDCSIRLWNKESGECHQILTGHSSDVKCLTVIPDGSIASGSFDGLIHIWRFADIPGHLKSTERDEESCSFM